MNGHLQRVVNTFDAALGRSYNTLLLGGFPEPEYLPAEVGGRAEIRFREDFLSSALHEVAHWCIAGERRRQLIDFGYWYWPEGRDGAQQIAFEKAEVKPQAVEWIFANACGQDFHLSRDNHGPGGQQSGFDFTAAVLAQALAYCRDGLPPRAARFARALAREFNRPAYGKVQLYSGERLK